MASSRKIIAFQGHEGAYSHQACNKRYPDMETLSCPSFEDTFIAVRDEKADLAMIPVDNTIAGRVADVHHILPRSGLYIIGEYFLPVRHALLATEDATIKDVKHVHSHVHAIPQCRELIRKHGFTPHVEADTAGAAALVAQMQDKSHAAIASPLAGKIYGLNVLLDDIHDEEHNTTRFLILSRDYIIPDENTEGITLTSFVFRVRNIPAALYKTLGGFATNGLNLVKLESYVDENFQAAQFYCEVEGHPDSRPLQLALEELGFYADEFNLLGSFPGGIFREKS